MQTNFTSEHRIIDLLVRLEQRHDSYFTDHYQNTVALIRSLIRSSSFSSRLYFAVVFLRCILSTFWLSHIEF